MTETAPDATAPTRADREAALRGLADWPGLRSREPDDVPLARLMDVSSWGAVVRKATREALDGIERTWLETGEATHAGRAFAVAPVADGARRDLCMPRRDAEAFLVLVHDGLGLAPPSSPVACRGRGRGFRRDAYLVEAEVAAELGMDASHPVFKRVWAEVKAAAVKGTVFTGSRGAQVRVASVPVEGGRAVAAVRKVHLGTLAAVVAERVHQAAVARWCGRDEVARMLGLVPESAPMARAWALVEDAATKGVPLVGGAVRVGKAKGAGARVAFDDVGDLADLARLSPRCRSLEWMSRGDVARKLRAAGRNGAFKEAVFSAMWASMMVEAQCGRPVLLGGAPARFERQDVGADGWRLHAADFPTFVAERRVVLGLASERPDGPFRGRRGRSADVGEASPSPSP